MKKYKNIRIMPVAFHKVSFGATEHPDFEESWLELK